MAKLIRTLSEHILELRFKPNPKILDYRGTWAEMVSQLMELPHWRIDENRIDVLNSYETDTFHAFVSFKNAGITLHNDSSVNELTKNFFPDQGNKLLRFLFDQKSFGNPIFVERVGVRSRFATVFDGAFKDLLQRYSTRIFSLTEEAKDAFRADLVDIGGPMNFSNLNGNLFTNSGPMEKKQLGQFFGFVTELPDVAFYMDLDYWKRPQSEMDGKEVVKVVKNYADEVWDIHDRIRAIVLE